MKYDLEIVVPMSGRYQDRILDFKNYGLVNIGNNKVLVHVITTNEEIKDIQEGWPAGVDVRVVKGRATNYVANVYGFFADIEEDKFDSRWIMKLDDDSFTDVGGLLSNLDKYYDHTGLYYLAATLRHFEFCHGAEHGVFDAYKSKIGDYFLRLLMHEIECCVVSNAALVKILKNPSSRDLLNTRRDVCGGATDVVLSFASCLAKIYPVDCPFLTHEPLVHDFSLLKGMRNHIHCVSRELTGENFNDWERAPKEAFTLLLKAIEGKNSEIEKKIINSRYLLETHDQLKTYKFLEKNVVSVKFEDHFFNWYEEDGSIVVLDKNRVIRRLKLDDQGNLREGDFVLTKID